MKLQQQLDAIKKGFVEQAPEQALEVMARSGEKLRNSGIMAKALQVGDTAPDFVLPDTLNNQVALTEILRHGPVVLNFFRGSW